VVHRGGYHGRYLRSGHLVYLHKGTLFAAPFDLERLELTGQPVPALDGVVSRPGSAGAQFSVSDQGLLAYLPGAVIGGGEVPIQWLDANGKTRVLQAAPADAGNLRFSPDGGRLAMDVYDGTQRDVWVYDWERDIMSRLTFDPENDNNPVWSPDGHSIVFSSARADKRPNLYLQPADGTGEAQRLTQSTHMQVPTSWHPSGKFLVFEQQSTQTTSDLLILPLESSAAGFKAGKPAVFLNSPRVECEAAFSPDGRWLAYVSSESGTYELFVRAFPGPGGKWQVSTGGGRFPTWSRAGKRLFYRSSDRKLMVSDYVVEGGSFHSGKPQVWSATPFELRGPYRPFDLHPDGQRFAVLKSLTSQAETKSNHVTLIFNFADELRRIAPARTR
jgi:serine/threonine-protein kinase